MRILDTSNNELQEKELDFAKGYLKPDKYFVKRHDAIEAVEEKFHWKVVAEYPNGGKDVEKIIDVPAVEAKEAYDEYEDIYRFVKFTTAQLNQNRIVELKQKLQETDYNILKLVEGVITLGEIQDVIKDRAQWRKEINDLESTIDSEG